MYCPSCGTEERQTSQFCRACGTDMRVVRTALQKPDSITASAISAREEIGRAIATRIQMLNSAKDLRKVVEEVLPEVEKFLESPEERRLRRMRNGVITAAAGLGAMIILLTGNVVFIPLATLGWPAGLLVFFIGIGLIINGLLFSSSKQSVADRTLERYAQTDYENQLSVNSNNTTANLPRQPASLFNNSNNLMEQSHQQYLSQPPSITEHTTRQLNRNATEEPKKITAELQ
jgi:hypothetical protein